MKWLCIALALVSTAGAGCPPEYPFQYLDRSHGFQICLPAGIKRGVTDDPIYPKGATLFTGFAVPAKTNLDKKDLIIVSGLRRSEKRRALRPIHRQRRNI